MLDLKSRVRDVPDFPRRGVIFKDITPLLLDPAALAEAVASLAARAPAADVVVAIESRGFIFGTALALRLGLPLVPARKFGKLPGRTARRVYSLEYGEDTLEIHADALRRDQRALIVDDLLATGGTALAGAELAEELGARVAALMFVIELKGLGGRARLAPRPVAALMEFEVRE
ncbi:MAG: adenine phosphoribosyltransferase [Candidatus Eiseniibacteriota bacterium]